MRRGSVRARLRVRFSQRERGAKCVEIVDGKDFDAAGIDVAERLLAAQNVQRGAAFGAGFREDEGAVGKIEREERLAAGEFGCGGCQCRRPAIMRWMHEPEIVAVDRHEPDGDALADAAEFADGAAFDGGDGRVDGAQHERRSAGARAPASGRGCAARARRCRR